MIESTDTEVNISHDFQKQTEVKKVSVELPPREWWLAPDEGCPEDFGDIYFGDALTQHPRQGPLAYQASLIRVIEYSAFENVKKNLAACEFNFDKLQEIHERVCKERDQLRRETEEFRATLDGTLIEKYRATCAELARVKEQSKYHYDEHYAAVLDVRKLTRENDSLNKLFNEWVKLLGPVPGTRVKELIKWAKRLRGELSKYGIAGYLEADNVVREFDKWLEPHEVKT